MRVHMYTNILELEYYKNGKCAKGYTERTEDFVIHVDVPLREVVSEVRGSKPNEFAFIIQKEER